MGTKERLLALLEANSGEYLSGAEIGQQLQVSRTAIWKAVNSLRDAGYTVRAVQNKGYCLDAKTDILSENGLKMYLSTDCDQVNPVVVPSAESTNALLREQANAGASEGTVIIANEQTKGRGRLGRKFFSPPDSGIYLSLLLRPEGYTSAQAVQLTTMAAAAASEAIEEVSGRGTGIKWVNDVYIGRKKVCGILTEASFSLETGSPEYIILGIGMNVYEPQGGFPAEIADIAGAIFYEQEKDGKNRLAASFLNHFMRFYRQGANANYAGTYRDKSIVIGRDISVISEGAQRSAVALDIDKDCHLIVRYEDGTIAQLSSGEISIRI